MQEVKQLNDFIIKDESARNRITKLEKYVSNPNTAAFHNTIVRGKDITAYFTDGSLYKRINGTDGYALFEDLYLGDYFQMPRTVTAPGSSVTGTNWITIAGFDIMLSNGSTAVTAHHITVVPGQFESGTQHFGTASMNTTDTTVGAYENSKMNTNVIGAVTSSGSTASEATINQQLYSIFGSHLLTTNELVSNAIDSSRVNRFGQASGASSSWAWSNKQAILMSEIEVYGSIVCSSSLYDTGTAKMQLPLFSFSRAAMNNRSGWYWLKDVASGSHFCNCDDYGSAYYGGAGIGGYVRPRFNLS